MRKTVILLIICIAKTLFGISDIENIKRLEKKKKIKYYDEKVLNELGYIYYNRGDLDKAAKIYEKLFRLNPDSISILMIIDLKNYYKGINKNRYEFYLDFLKDYFHEKKMDIEFIEIVKEIIIFNINNEGDINETMLSLYNDVLEKDQDNFFFLDKKAMYFYGKNDLENAHNTYKTLFKFYPNNRSVIRKLIDINDKLKRKDNVVSYYIKLITLTNNSEELIREMKEYIKRADLKYELEKRTEKTISQDEMFLNLEKIFKHNEKDYGLAESLAKHFYEKDQEKSVYYYEKFFDNFPYKDNPEKYNENFFKLLNLYYKFGFHENYLSICNKYLEKIEINNQDVLCSKAFILYIMNRVNESKKLINQILVKTESPDFIKDKLMKLGIDKSFLEN